jgi:hypothetical protein
MLCTEGLWQIVQQNKVFLFGGYEAAVGVEPSMVAFPRE